MNDKELDEIYNAVIEQPSILKSKANAYDTIINRWKDDEIFKLVRDELIKDGCYSEAVIFNSFVERLRDLN